MEQEIKSPKKRHFLRILAGIALLALAMYALAVLGYRFARNSAPRENSQGAQNSSEYAPPDESHTPFNLPTALQTVVPEETAAESPAPAKDKNDYLVIAEGSTVRLYLITENGEQIFSKDLPIPLAALMPEDRAQLAEGIILDSEDALASLLEDYSS